MRNNIFYFLFVAIAFVSCSDDDDTSIVEPEVNAPEVYEFSRNGESTVSFGGQTTRIEMATEMISTFKDWDNLSEQQLLNMFNNEQNPFSDATLNASSKNLQSKTASSAEYFASNQARSAEIKEFIKDWFEIQAEDVKPNRNTIASAGVAGQLADGSSTRYVDSKGFEPNQIVAKSLIGALMVDQALNNYLSPLVLDAGSNIAENDTDITVADKPYTMMEHKWDEAYGYLYGKSQNASTPNATLGDDSFLNKYIGRVDGDSDFSGIADDIFNAFKLGRAAIVAKNYDVRDEQVDIIQSEVSKVIGVRAVHYLQAAKSALVSENYGAAAHDLSEAIGFVYSLQFTHNPSTNQPYLSGSEVDNFIDDVMTENGLWSLSETTLHQWSETIANQFDFTVEQAAN